MYFKQVKAVLQKRINIYKRNLRGLILEVFVPVLIVLIGLGLTRLEFFKSAPSRPHSVDLFPAF
jgi:ATP-binding cassette subfamily A (ABC1) protein 3